jgi:hypothetical protein
MQNQKLKEEMKKSSFSFGFKSFDNKDGKLPNSLAKDSQKTIEGTNKGN